MMLDALDQLMNAYAPTTHGAAQNNGVFLDRLVAMEEGAGEPLYLFGRVKTAPTSGGSATVQFQLIGNPSDNTFASGNVVVLDTGAIAIATLVAGYEFFRAPIPRVASGSPEVTGSLLRYWTINVTIGTADLTAGAFDAWMTAKPLQDMLGGYARGYNV